MTFPTQSSLHGTIKQLKDIVVRLQREDREAVRLVKRMEVLVLRIERKVKIANRGKIQAGSPATIQAANSASALSQSDTASVTI